MYTVVVHVHCTPTCIIRTAHTNRTSSLSEQGSHTEAFMGWTTRNNSIGVWIGKRDCYDLISSIGNQSPSVQSSNQ